VILLSRIGSATSLVHRGRVELEGLLQDVSFHIVFTLIYDVGLGLEGRNDITARRVTLLCAVKTLQSHLACITGEGYTYTSTNVFLLHNFIIPSFPSVL